MIELYQYLFPSSILTTHEISAFLQLSECWLYICKDMSVIYLNYMYGCIFVYLYKIIYIRGIVDRGMIFIIY